MKGVITLRRKFRKNSEKKTLDIDPALLPGEGEDGGLQGHRSAAIKHCKKLLGTLTKPEDIDSMNFVIHVLGEGESNKVHRKSSLTREFRRRGTDAAVQEYILKNVVGPSHQGEHLSTSEGSGFPDLIADRLDMFKRERIALPIASAVVPTPLKSKLLKFIATKVDPNLRMPIDDDPEILGDDVFEVLPLINSPDLERVLSNVSSWFDFDVLELNYITQGRPLVHVCMALLNKYNLFDQLPIDYNSVLVALTAVEACYTDTNPYHNRTHAADVVQACSTQH
eukprot:c10095_g1_i5.p1 GENE.c10095_g1_i5~~c10095_g1_i5.p1  ORF type:complete len:281 (-),score=58.52 c10095_g1_i5:63-905(-)